MDGPTWNGSILEDDFQRTTVAPSASSLAGWDQAFLSGSSYFYIARMRQSLPRDADHWPGGSDIGFPYGYGTPLTGPWGEAGDTTAHIESAGAERQYSLAMATRRIVTKAQCKQGYKWQTQATGHSAQETGNRGFWLAPPIGDPEYGMPPPSGYHSTGIVAGRSWWRQDISGVWGEFAMPYDPARTIWLEDGDVPQFGVCLARNEDNAIIALCSRYRWCGDDRWTSTWRGYTPTSLLRPWCHVWRVIWRNAGVDTELYYSLSDQSLCHLVRPVVGVDQVIFYRETITEMEYGPWYHFNPSRSFNLDVAVTNWVRNNYVRRAGLIADIPAGQSPAICFHDMQASTDAPAPHPPVEDVDDGVLMDSPVHQVIRGAANHPTTEYAFSGAAALMVDYGTYLDASEFATSWLGDRSLLVGSGLAQTGYGYDYGENHGG